MSNFDANGGHDDYGNILVSKAFEPVNPQLIRVEIVETSTGTSQYLEKNVSHLAEN